MKSSQPAPNFNRLPGSAFESGAVQPAHHELRLGNPELPIAAYRERIVTAVDESQAVVITAETGAGKSTQVPQFLAESGYKVIVTQPRVVAARTVAERVREEVTAKCGDEFNGFVGYRTARERGDSIDNQILFVTDGLQTVRELAGQGVGKKQVLVLDEVHEWNENMEVLVAWAKKRMSEDPDFKVVTMSATMEADTLSEFFAIDEKADTLRDVPVIDVPGRTFEVKKEEGGDVIEQAARLARGGKNTLVFVPGKAEIEQVIAGLKASNIPDAVVLPLHGQLEPAEQRRVFQKYDGVKVIVATNVAQTSITIEDIDAVVDSGLERINEVKNGVEGLYLRPISQADCLQRAGRAGRTKEGEYVLARLGNYQFIPLKDREAYGTPEILRIRLDGMVLRLAKGGLDPEDLEFYNQPDPAEIAAAKSRLVKLGALTERGDITGIGRRMERMPLESHYARMMIEARRYGPEVRAQMAAMLAAQEAGGVTLNGKNSGGRWRKLTSGDTSSDMIVQLEVFMAAQDMSQGERRDHDVMGKDFSKACDVLRQLRHAENLPAGDLTTPTKEQREQLVRCIVAGMVDNLYINHYGSYRNGDVTRALSNRSVVWGADMVVGLPFDLETQTRRGPMTLHLIESATKVPSVDVLRDVAPQLFSEKSLGLTTQDGRVVESRELYFNGAPMGRTVYADALPSQESLEYMVDYLCSGSYATGLFATVKALHDLQAYTTEQLPVFTEADIRRLLLETVPPGINDISEAAALIPEIPLTDIVPAEKIAGIRAASPARYAGMELRYANGIPVTVMDDETLLAWDGPFELPDGREITIRPSYYYGSDNGRPLRERQQELISAREKAEQAEIERRRFEARQSKVDALQERLKVETNKLSVNQHDLRHLASNLFWYPENSDEWIERASSTLGEIAAVIEQEERERVEREQQEEFNRKLQESGGWVSRGAGADPNDILLQQADSTDDDDMATLMGLLAKKYNGP